MEMSGLVPFIAMIVQQLAQVGSAVTAKMAMSTGMTSFTYTFYSSAFSTLLLIPIVFFLYRNSSSREMEMSGLVPFIAMIVQQLAQVGSAVTAKMAMSTGMTSFTYTFYSSAFSTLLLIPICFFLYRSALPPLRPALCYGFFWLGIMGFFMQVVGFLGLQYSSPLLSTAILQIIPGFTFIFAVILRMESFEYKSLSTQAKTIGTLVSIIGALVASLYKGPQVFGFSLLNSILTNPSAWAIGGLLTMISSLIASLFIISQAFILRKYPAELILMLFYSCCVTILCAVFSLITERDLSSWSLSPHNRLMALIYSGLFGNVFQVSIGAWCVRKRGPLFVVMFHPLGIVIAMIASICMGDIIHVGSLVGSVIIVLGFYSVIWGKAKEWKKEEKNSGSNNKKMPLLQDKVDNDPEVNL